MTDLQAELARLKERCRLLETVNDVLEDDFVRAMCERDEARQKLSELEGLQRALLAWARAHHIECLQGRWE